ncbi:MAG: cation:proton antiporter [Actinomycetota bacterium]|nr:cation:proton antiporter [Actinomycetota bacterium]
MVTTPKDVILTVTLMLAAGLAARLAADLLRLPQMLILLGAGILLGPSVSGAIDVPLDSMGAQLILTLGVSFILFHGGLQLSVGVLSKVSLGLFLLTVPGVVLTAVIVGPVAAAAFGVPLATGLLIGAALAPTDPAILVPLFERLRLRPKVSQTIIAESALNDPTGAVLALAFAGFVLSGQASWTHPMTDFISDLAISTAMGIIFGIVLSAAVSSHRAGIWRESAAIAVVAVVAGSSFSIDSIGGSGYLGAFLAGLVVANMDRLKLAMHTEHEHDMRVLVAVVADVMVMLVFITLGANLPWSAISDHFAPALVVLAALILVARPLVVLACLLPDRRARWTREELLFLAWTRETGVVPAAVAGLMVSMKVPHADLVVTTVALAIVLTLALQTTTKPWLARRLRLMQPVPVPAEEPPAESAARTASAR